MNKKNHKKQVEIKIPKSYFKKFQTKKYFFAGRLKRYFINNFICHITQIFKTINPESTIELGCGEGFVCGWLSSLFQNTKFSGADISKNDLTLLQKHFPQIATYNFDLLSIANSPISNQHFDLFLCLETLEHLEKPEKFLFELKKLNYNNLIISAPWEPFFQLSNFLRGQNIKNFGNDPGHINH